MRSMSPAPPAVFLQLQTIAMDFLVLGRGIIPFPALGAFHADYVTHQVFLFTAGELFVERFARPVITSFLK